MLYELRDVAKTGLNERIAAIAVEKADQVVLKPVVDDAYFVQSLNDAVAAFDPFFFIYIDTMGGQVSGPALIKKPTMVASIVFATEGEDAEIARKALRYLRALEETYLRRFAGFSSGFKVDVESLVPTQFRYMNSTDEAMAVGVQLTVSIA